ncbi:hypothetical protein ONJ95_26330, partial [Salmonella enterica subsp. enterica serovar Virginia]|nr:hypothetical protein [Salmonella enterica subsp. enterica serovar Virginia]
YQQGAFDYLPKPFDIDEAVALVERAISHYQEQQQPRNIEVNGSPSVAILDSDDGMGHCALIKATDHAISLARETGLGFVSVKNT